MNKVLLNSSILSPLSVVIVDINRLYHFIGQFDMLFNRKATVLFNYQIQKMYLNAMRRIYFSIPLLSMNQSQYNSNSVSMCRGKFSLSYFLFFTS